LSLLSHDLSQAEKKITAVASWATDKMTTIFTQNDNFDHFESVAQLVKQLHSSQLEISHVLNGTTPESQHRKWEPKMPLYFQQKIVAAPIYIFYATSRIWGKSG
jgi:hypothetical protein